MTPHRSPTARGLLLGLMLLPLAAVADEAPLLGEQTRDWLSLQKAQKPEQGRPMTGEQAKLIYRRYVQSFGREIPEQLRREDGPTASQ